MGTSKNWGNYSRQTRMREAALRPSDGPKVAEVFAALEYYLSNPEKVAGNWIVLPRELTAGGDEKTPKFKTAHRNKKCAVTLGPFAPEAGDRLFRVSNEVVEMLALMKCPVCSPN